MNRGEVGMGKENNLISSQPMTVAKSRPTTSATSQSGVTLTMYRATKDKNIKSLSASGSSQAPKSDVTPQRRATKPSSPSLAPAAANTRSAAVSCPTTISQAAKGAANNLSVDRRLGTSLILGRIIALPSSLLAGAGERP